MGDFIIELSSKNESLENKRFSYDEKRFEEKQQSF